MSTQPTTLLDRLESFSLDEPGVALPFTRRLARENGWTLVHAGRVVAEYKRFVFLSMEAGHPVTPSEAVDQAWHLHLLYTRHYWETMCRDLLGRPLHHGPTQGGGAEARKFDDWYERTLESYRRLFRMEPPADIWPCGKERFAARQWQRIDRSRWWLVPKLRLPSWRLRGSTAGLLGVMLALAGCATAAGRSQVGLTPVLIPALMAAGVFGWWLGRDRSSRPASQRALTPLEWALLAGGPVRVAQAALGSLHVRGAVTTGSPKTHSFVLTRTLTPDDPALERMAAGTSFPPCEFTRASLVSKMENVVRSARKNLVSEGLLRSPSSLARARGLAVAPFAPALGVCAAIPSETAAGFVMAVGVTLMAAGWVAAKVPVLTRSGESRLRHVRQQHADLATPTRSRLLADAEAPGLAIALFGPSCLASAGWGLTSEYLKPPQPADSSSGSGGSGCGGGCGHNSGCGSSGCGSSGCGSSCGGGD